MSRQCYLCLFNEEPPQQSKRSFHKFPSNVELRDLWLQVCGLSQTDDVSKIKICSLHFLDNDYRTPQGGQRLILKPGAIPSVGALYPITQQESKYLPSENLNTVFENNNSMRIHRKLKDFAEPIACQLCGLKIKKNKMKAHLSQHQKKGEFVESHSEESNGAAQPEETDHSESVREICHADYSAEGLEVHESSHDVKPFKCECSGVFFSESEYKKHLKDNCEVVKSDLKLVDDVKVEIVKEELEIGFEDDTEVEEICRTPKRKFAEPRFVSEITTPDVSTPRQARRVLSLVHRTDKEKSKKIKGLQDRNRYLLKRFASLKEAIKRLNGKGLISDEGSNILMSLLTQKNSKYLPHCEIEKR